MRTIARAACIATAAVGLAAGPVFAAGMVEGPKVSWQISVFGNPRAVTSGFAYIAKTVGEHTGGKFKIRIAYGEQLAPAKEGLDGLKIGAFEGAMICSSYHPGKNPAMTALDLPFLPFPNINVEQKVFEHYYKNPVVLKELAAWNAMPYIAALLPQYEFMGKGKPPATLADWQGKRVRALGGLGDAMRVIGAHPITVPAPEVYTSLDRGVVDAASFPFSYAFAAYKLEEVSNWYTANMAIGAVNCFYGLSITAWNKLPPQYQKLMNSLKPEAYEIVKKAYKAADEKNLPAFKKRGLQAITYSETELDKFRAAAGKPVWDAWVKQMDEKGLPGDALLKDILETAKKSAGS